MADGRQALLWIRVSGDLIGEISALNGTPRSASATAHRHRRPLRLRRGVVAAGHA
jgi:CRP-like cAMP-binding protein